jgi:hypothetical protein
MGSTRAVSALRNSRGFQIFKVHYITNKYDLANLANMTSALIAFTGIKSFQNRRRNYLPVPLIYSTFGMSEAEKK